MRRAGAILAVLCAATASTLAIPSAQAAAPAPALGIASVAIPTDFLPADPDPGNEYSYQTWIANEGGTATDGSPVTVTETLPPGVPVEAVKFNVRYENVLTNFGEGPGKICETETVTEVTTVTCTVPEELPGSGEESALLNPGEEWYLKVNVGVGGLSEGEALADTVTVQGGGAPEATRTIENEASASPAPAGLAESSVSVSGPDGQPLGQAAAHPYQMATRFFFNTAPKSPNAESLIPPYTTSGGDAKDVPVALPPGLIGNPQAVARCPLQQFNTSHLVQPFPARPDIQLQQNECPDDSAVGYFSVRYGEEATSTFLYPIYNLVPPPGMPAQLGFNFLTFPIYIDTEAKPSTGYKVVAAVRNISEAKRVIGGTVTLWGTPDDPSHDPIRGHCLSQSHDYPISLEATLGPCPGAVPAQPFLRLPSDCAGPLGFTMGLDTWADPGAFVFAQTTLPAPSGCGALAISPTLEARPTTDVADSPTGLQVDLHMPQEEPLGLGEADLRDAVVTLPKGIAVNPSGANGLEGCSESEIGYLGKAEGTERFSDDPAHCPGASRIGEVEVDTPLLEKPVTGGVYAALPDANPFGSLLAIYIAVEDPERGVTVKLAGHVEADPVSGQLKTTVARSPQVPFSDFKLKFRKGALAPLRTPRACGTYATTSQMTPWSAPDSGPPATPSDAYAIARSPDGGPCPSSEGAAPNAPAFEAGTVAPIAGAYSPIVVHLRRSDGSQEFGQVTLTPPPGLLARLAEIPCCPEAALAAAAARAGRAEEAAPSCPAASRVGSVEVAAGAGPAPYYARGAAYLAGPYKGAPLSLAIVTPAAAGPFDLGTVVVRTAIYVNPATAQITAVSDPIPHILEGIPLDVRSIAVTLDHPGWGLNPTSCDPMAFAGTLLSTLGQAAPLMSRFQVGECGRLGFKPKLALSLKGPTRRGGFPKLHALYRAREGDADLRRMVLRLPPSEFVEQGHFRTICTRVQYAAGQCPPGAVYGHVRAYTPLLSQPLEGPVYLRSSSHNLPDVVFALHGQVDAEVAIRIDSVNGGLRATIENAPDVPVSKVILDMQGGQKGLLVNSRNVCSHRYRADAQLRAQNGTALELRPVVGSACGGGHRRAGHQRNP